MAPGEEKLLILNVDEHGNQTISFEGESSSKRARIDSESSMDCPTEEGNYHRILEKRIKIESGEECQEMTAVLIQDEDDGDSSFLDGGTETARLVEDGGNDLGLPVIDDEFYANAGFWNPLVTDNKSLLPSDELESTRIMDVGEEVDDDDDDDDGDDELEDVERSLDMVNGITEGPGLVFQDQLEATDDNEDTTYNIETSEDETGILMQYMDIREPLSTLKGLLEERLGLTLTDYTFWLQDSQSLESHKNLVDQCVQGEGMVQINVQIKTDELGNKKINIVDVLKPAEEFVEIESMDGDVQSTIKHEENDQSTEESSDGKPIVRWIVDGNFKREQQRLNIPQDPQDWALAHVRHWLLWAVRQFNLPGIKLQDWGITGTELCQLSLEEYRKKVPSDPGDVFWTHLELLRKCKFAAVIQKNVKEPVDEIEKDVSSPSKRAPRTLGSIKQRGCIRVAKPKSNKVLLVQEYSPQCGNRTGNNGQIQLWQFLLELLTDKKHRHAIQWLGGEGEFKLVNPEVVAHLWGERKNKPTMNYEKLSRALRYYYEGDMISKVQGKRFVYKFVCDLKALLGYSASQLNRLVMEAERKWVNYSQMQSLFGSTPVDFVP